MGLADGGLWGKLRKPWFDQQHGILWYSQPFSTFPRHRSWKLGIFHGRRKGCACLGSSGSGVIHPICQGCHRSLVSSAWAGAEFAKVLRLLFLGRSWAENHGFWGADLRLMMVTWCTVLRTLRLMRVQIHPMTLYMVSYAFLSPELTKWTLKWAGCWFAQLRGTINLSQTIGTIGTWMLLAGPLRTRSAQVMAFFRN